MKTLKLIVIVLISIVFDACKTNYQMVHSKNDFLENQKIRKNISSYDIQIQTPNGKFALENSKIDSIGISGYISDLNVSRIDSKNKEKFLQIYTEEIFPDSIIGFNTVTLSSSKITGIYEKGLAYDSGKNEDLAIATGAGLGVGIMLIVVALILSSVLLLIKLMLP